MEDILLSSPMMLHKQQLMITKSVGRLKHYLVASKPERISKLVALLAIAFCWCNITGEWLNADGSLSSSAWSQYGQYWDDYKRDLACAGIAAFNDYEWDDNKETASCLYPDRMDA